jgi:hypothetical protein
MAHIQSAQRGIGLTSLMLLASVSLLAGCGGMVNDAPTASTLGAGLQGNVHGGQSPVSGATIQLYAAATATGAAGTGYGAASTALLVPGSVTTNSSGAFNIPSGSFTCPASPNDQIYLVATSGNPGGGTNPNLAEAAVLGTCSTLGTTLPSFIVVNEITTAATAYALSGFTTNYASVGTSAGNYTGLKNAFATFFNLVNLANGTPLSVTPAYATQATGTNSTTFASAVPQSKLYALGDILAGCVNTQGASSANCTTLFSDTATTGGGGGSSTPDTFQAALSIAQHPGRNATALYSAFVNGSAVWPSPSQAISPAPSDWTIAVSFIGGGLGGSSFLNQPASAAIAVDGSGNVWIPNNQQNTVTELNPLGAPLSPNATSSGNPGGYPETNLNGPYSVAVDLSGNAWVGNSAGTISVLGPQGSMNALSPVTGTGLGSAVAVAFDASGNLWAVDLNNQVDYINTTTKATLAAYNSPGNIAGPEAVAVDDANDAWVLAGSNLKVARLNNSGVLLAIGPGLNDNVGSVEIDASGNAWVPEAGNVEKFTASGSNVSYTISSTASGISNPGGLSIDGAGDVWIASAGGANGQSANPDVLEVTSGGSLVAGESANGYTGSGPVNTPIWTAVDASGNLWVLNGNSSLGSGASTVTEYVGAAAPTYSPLAAAVAAGRVGLKP